MLILRRREGESIRIAEDVELIVLEISGTRVKLGIRAPENTPVVRGEIRLTGEENRRAAAPATPSALAELVKKFSKL